MPVSPTGWKPVPRLFLYDLGVLQHRDPAGARELAIEGDRFPGVFGELVAHRFVISHDEIRFPIAQNRDRPAALNAGRPARRMLFAASTVIRVTHQVDDL